MKKIAALLLAICLPFSTQAEDEMIESSYKKATFAGGCFWCMEKPFDAIDGVISTTSGYTDGHKDNPTYHQVSAGTTGHTEALQVVYDPAIVSYERLLEVFWHNIDPLDADGQFCDRGSQYRSGVFYHDDAQKEAAEASKQAIDNSDTLETAIVTQVVKASTFYDAEDYHQNYYKVNPIRYKYYRYSCGRDKRLESLWGNKAGH